jgi:hypothetical protein
LTLQREGDVPDLKPEFPGLSRERTTQMPKLTLTIELSVPIKGDSSYRVSAGQWNCLATPDQRNAAAYLLYAAALGIAADQKAIPAISDWMEFLPDGTWRPVPD